MEILDKYKYIIFDFDGTIVKLNIDWVGLKNELNKVFGIDFTPLNQALEKLDKESREIAFKIIEKYESHATYEVNEKLIRYIISNNKNYAILSDNMTSTIITILNKLNIKNKFRVIIGRDKVKKYKPNIEGMIKILNYFKVDNLKEVIYVGDSKKDELIARKLSIDFLNIKLWW